MVRRSPILSHSVSNRQATNPMSRTFYVNGDFVAEADAKISVLDRGFLFADAVYEVSSIIDGKLIDNKAHLARLARSLGELNMAPPATDDAIVKAQHKLVELNGVEEGLLYLQVSRGEADRDFAFPANPVSSLVMFTQTKNLLESPAAERGFRIVSMPDQRWGRRDIKTVQLLAPSLAKQAALDAGVDDAWMVEDGKVTEGTSNNAYIVTGDKTIHTRHLGNEILAGITRSAVLKFARDKSISRLRASVRTSDTRRVAFSPLPGLVRAIPLSPLLLILAACGGGSSSDSTVEVDDQPFSIERFTSDAGLAPAVTGMRDGNAITYRLLEDDLVHGAFADVDAVAGLVSVPQSGRFEVAIDNRSFVYVPAPDFNGLDGFAYRLAQGIVTVNLEVLPSDDAPALSANIERVAAQGTTYSDFLLAEDPDGDALRFFARELPAWLSLDPVTGELSGLPLQSDAGISTPFDLGVTDDTGLSDELLGVRIEVLDINDAPTVNATRFPAYLPARSSLDVQVFVDDPDGEQVQLRIEPNRFNCAGIARLICADRLAVFEAAVADYPDVDQIVLLVNDARFGGSAHAGGGIAIASRVSPGLALHEMGHSLAGLGDEYVDATLEGLVPSVPGAAAPLGANIADDPSAPPWAHWLQVGDVPGIDRDPSAPFEPGVFEGAQYVAFGRYRPTVISRMRDVDAFFGPVNGEAWVLALYRKARPVRGFAPLARELSVETGQLSQFTVSPWFDPSIQRVVWELNGNPLNAALTGGESQSNTVELLLPTGRHEVSVSVVDISDAIRRPSPHEGEFDWVWAINVR